MSILSTKKRSKGFHLLFFFYKISGVISYPFNNERWEFTFQKENCVISKLHYTFIFFFKHGRNAIIRKEKPWNACNDVDKIFKKEIDFVTLCCCKLTKHFHPDHRPYIRTIWRLNGAHKPIQALTVILWRSDTEAGGPVEVVGHGRTGSAALLTLPRRPRPCRRRCCCCICCWCYGVAAFEKKRCQSSTRAASDIACIQVSSAFSPVAIDCDE